MDLNEMQFTSGFNNGFLIAKYEPDFAYRLLGSIRQVNSYVQGIVSGIQEYETIQAKDRLDDFKELRSRNLRERDTELE